jgi:general secretion pathway protein C
MRIRLSDRYVTALNFILIAAIAYFAALSADDLIARRLTAGSGFEPPIRAARSTVTANLTRASYSVIAERDVFNSVKQAPAPSAAVAANLHIKLLGTSELTAAKPFAIIEDENNHQQALYRLGDEIPDAGTLVEVERKRVLINHQGQIMALEIPEGDLASVPPTPSRSPESSNRNSGFRRAGHNQFVVERAVVDQNLQNMGSLLTQMRAVPNLENGKTNGFRLSEIQQGSIFQQMGLRDGDIVKNIAGQEINDPMRAMELVSVLQNQQAVAIEVMRNGRPVKLSYEIR